MRFLRHEARTVLALARLLGRRVPAGFTYHRGLRRMVGLLAIGVLVEGVIVDLLLAATLPGTPWPWIVLALHGWAAVELAGVYAGLATRPHLLDDDALLIRDGHGPEIRVPLADIVSARRIDEPVGGRSGLVVDGGRATLAHSRATVQLRVDPALLVGEDTVRTVRLTADDPDRLLAGLAR
jgi:hypothetical protein